MSQHVVAHQSQAKMPLDALVPNDPRVEEKYFTFSDDIKYHYILAKPAGKPTATVLLCHGLLVSPALEDFEELTIVSVALTSPWHGDTRSHTSYR